MEDVGGGKESRKTKWVSCKRLDLKVASYLKWM